MRNSHSDFPDSRHASVSEWPAQYSLPGRRFAAKEEQTLYPDLRFLASTLPRATDGVIVIPEMVGPVGVPDLVAVVRTPALDARLAAGIAPIRTWNDARLVAHCGPTRGLSIESLSHRMGAETKATRRRVMRLERQGALVVSRGLVSRDSRVQPLGRVYALEAKVADWSGAISQALRYATWADGSGVVLARLPRDVARVVDTARDLGVGLALQSKWLVRPRIHRLSTANRLLTSEYIVAALGVQKV